MSNRQPTTDQPIAGNRQPANLFPSLVGFLLSVFIFTLLGPHLDGGWGFCLGHEIRARRADKGTRTTASLSL